MGLPVNISKQQCNCNCRQCSGPDPDADAGGPVAPALRLGEPLNRMIVEPQPLLDKSLERVRRPLGLAQELRDVGHEFAYGHSAFGCGLELRAKQT